MKCTGVKYVSPVCPPPGLVLRTVFQVNQTQSTPGYSQPSRHYYVIYHVLYAMQYLACGKVHVSCAMGHVLCVMYFV